MKQVLDNLGLAVSMCTGTVGLAANDDQATAPLRDITPHLDLAERFGCDLVRVMIKEADDIPWTRRAADIARERGDASRASDPHPHALRGRLPRRWTWCIRWIARTSA